MDVSHRLSDRVDCREPVQARVRGIHTVDDQRVHSVLVQEHGVLVAARQLETSTIVCDKKIAIKLIEFS